VVSNPLPSAVAGKRYLVFHKLSWSKCSLELDRNRTLVVIEPEPNPNRTRTLLVYTNLTRTRTEPNPNSEGGFFPISNTDARWNRPRAMIEPYRREVKNVATFYMALSSGLFWTSLQGLPQMVKQWMLNRKYGNSLSSKLSAYWSTSSMSLASVLM